MNVLCEAALSVLDRVYSAETGLFPFTTRLEGGTMRSTYDHPMVVRSTVNCLLGLQEAARHLSGHSLLSTAGAITERFLRLHEGEIHNAGDLGLTLVLLSEGDHDARAAGRLLARITDLAQDEGRLRGANVQDLSWMVWGCVAAAARGVPGAEPLAQRLFTVLRGSFVRPGAVLPEHDLHIARRGIVSFGASVYYLKVAHAYATHFADTAALASFRRGVAALLAVQGPAGEWPWLLHTADGRPLDVYPVFSVHQHSMSMLFLQPAEADGTLAERVPGAAGRSMAWVMGENQLGVPMLRRDPLFLYRSIERRSVWPRAGRYLRARVVAASRRTGGPAPNARVRINTESRSYELGWILYVLSHRTSIGAFEG
jgi:hypothetical protein